MPRRPGYLRCCLLACLAPCLLLMGTPLHAETHLVTFAGGPNPQSDQNSLEQNVLYFRRTLDVLHLAGLKHEEFFADAGRSPHAVEIHVHHTAAATLTDDIAAVLNPDTERDVRFRAANIPALAGPSTFEALAHWFDTTGKSLPPHARLIFYFTGHGGTIDMPMSNMNPGGRGGRGARRPLAPVADPRNTTMLLWNSPDLTVTDFEKQLDKLDPTIDVTLLMVQCHSGGFANVLYKDADPKSGLVRQLRCGFFASTADRPAAGCTPDIDRDDYEEFSTGFFAALSGVTRDGKKIPKPDYDHDGQTSLADAFTYVVLTSNTIDTPITTSDQFLRDTASIPNITRNGLLGKDATYADLLAAANPFQRAILAGLSQTLNLSGDNRSANARSQIALIDRDRGNLDRQHAQIERQFDQSRENLRIPLTLTWPELGIPLHPATETILMSETSQLHKYLEGLRAWPTYQQASQQLADLEAQDTVLEKQNIKFLRFLYTADSVALAHNLQTAGDAKMQAIYADLLLRENRPLAEK